MNNNFVYITSFEKGLRSVHKFWTATNSLIIDIRFYLKLTILQGLAWLSGLKIIIEMLLLTQISEVSLRVPLKSVKIHEQLLTSSTIRFTNVLKKLKNKKM